MTNSSLTINSVLQRSTGSYQCRADNQVGSATSTTATLSIASTLLWFENLVNTCYVHTLNSLYKTNSNFTAHILW